MVKNNKNIYPQIRLEIGEEMGPGSGVGIGK
jgi:hypothetical protein